MDKKKNKSKNVPDLKITRFVVLPDERGLLLGKDTQGIFTPKMVYTVVDLGLGEPVIRQIGKYVLPESGYYSEQSDVNKIVTSGYHIWTQEELDLISNYSNDQILFDTISGKFKLKK